MVSQDAIIIIVVVSLLLVIAIGSGIVIFLCCRKRMASLAREQDEQRRKPRPKSDSKPLNLGHLPNAAETKRIEEGKEFVSVSELRSADSNSKTLPTESEYGFIMGPTAELSERDKKVGVDNDAYNKENQVESGAYLRGGIDPADVAEAFMEDEFLKEASRPQTRRKEQLEVRRKQARENSKKRSSQTRNSKKDSSENSNGQSNGKPRNSKRSSDKR